MWGAATIADTLVLTGRLVPNAERTRAVSARFPGPIREVTHSVGDMVKAGTRLASVESNESLEAYPVTAPIDGMIVKRHANPGGAAERTALCHRRLPRQTGRSWFFSRVTCHG